MVDGVGVQPLARIGEDQEFLMAPGNGIVERGRLAAMLGMAQHRHARIIQRLGGTGRVLVVAIDGQQHTDPASRIMAVQAAADLATDQVRGVACHDHHGNGGQGIVVGCHSAVRARCGSRRASRDTRRAGRPAGFCSTLQLLQLPAQQPWIAEVRVHHPRCGDDVDQYPEGVHALSQSSLEVSSVRGVRSSSARSLSCPPLPSSCFDSRSTR